MTERPQIGLYRRVSTRHQIDNERYLSAFRDMTEVIERYDGDPVLYDEGGHGVSGATIRGRKVFERMLADVASGELDGIAAPDVRSLSRGEWMIDGKTIADTLIHAGAILITRDGRYDLRRRGDLRSFQDRLYFAMQERSEITRRFYEGQAGRARNVVDGTDRPWGRHRTMLGHHLELLYDEHGKPRITARGLAKRAWAKDPAQAEKMVILIRELDAQHTRGGLFQALYDAGVYGPELSVAGGWTKRSLRTLLRSPFHQGHWPLVRNPKATIWYGLDPRSDEFDAKTLATDCPELAYWTPAQALRWEQKFMHDDDRSRRPAADKVSHAHPLLGLLRCPQCHRTLLGKGSKGYICPVGAKGTKYPDPCLPMFTISESSAQDALRALLPLLRPRLADLRDEAQAWLKQRSDGTFAIRLRSLDNEERAMLAQLQALVAQGHEVPASFTERLVELANERKRTLAEQEKVEQVEESRLEAERALAGIDPDELVEVLGDLKPEALSEIYRAFFAWVEARPNGPGRMGGYLVASKFHNEEEARRLQLVHRLLVLAA